MKKLIFLFLIFTIPLFAQVKRAPLWEYSNATTIRPISDYHVFPFSNGGSNLGATGARFNLVWFDSATTNHLSNTTWTLNSVAVTSTGTQINYINGATGTTGTTTTNIVFSTSPVLVTPTLGVATGTSLALGDGTVALPSLSFSNDPNTGIYRKGADTLGIAVNGANQVTVTTTGVGIGTTTPGDKLHVVNSTAGEDVVIYLDADTAGGGIAAYSGTFSIANLADRFSIFGKGSGLVASGLDIRADGASSDIRFYTGGNAATNERVRIQSDGNINIGATTAIDTQSPDLVITGDADSDGTAFTTEALTLSLTSNATPTLATWGFTSTQGAGYTFDKAVTVTGAITGSGNFALTDPGTSANSYSISLKADNATTVQEGTIQVMYGADPYMRFSAPNDAGTATAIMDLKDQRVVIGSSGAGVDYDVYFQGETNQGNITYMEDEDRFDFDNGVRIGGEFGGATINNQFSNNLSGNLLGITAVPKFLNTLLGTPTTDAANMIDVSGAGHNGTYRGTWAAAQKVNKGFGWILNPNGTDNYIDLGDADDFSFGTGAADIAFSIAGVIEVTTTGTNRMIFSKWDATTGTELREYQLYLGTDDKFYFIFYDESANVQTYRVTNAAITNGYRTFVITYDGGGGATAANGITIYIDGTVVASTASNDGSYVAMENLATSVFIGVRTGASAKDLFMPTDFTPPIIDKGTVWTALQVNRFHQYMKGQFNL